MTTKPTTQSINLLSHFAHPRGRTARTLPLLALILLRPLLHAADPFEENIRKTDPRTPEEERLGFHLPPGFEAQLVACEPDIGKPMNIAFDAAGRLWLAQSREYPYAAPLDKPSRDKIMVLSDFDKKGRAQKVISFAESLNIPIGLYPYKNGVIGFSIPNIYFFADTNHDSHADTRQLVLGRFDFTRDVHGLTSAFRRGFDGWVYADHGFANNSTLTAKDGSTITINSGNCYRFKVDGSHVEQYSWGQVNPFGLMFDQYGDLWSADCHSSPVYQLLRGAYYPSFGKPHDGLGFAPDVCTHSHGSTAIAGIVYYAAADFPPEFQGNAFSGNVMTSRIDRDSFVEHGSTRITKHEPEFLRSDDPWFRPVDLRLGPEGAIYVADFYNRVIGHYEVPLDHPGRDRERGRIWRIAYVGAPASPAKGTLASESTHAGKQKDRGTQNFDLSRATPADLIRELASPNVTRRMMATDQLVDRLGQAAIAPVTKMVGNKKSNAFQKSHGLWVLQRLNALSERILAAASKDNDPLVRVHTMRVLSEMASWGSPERELSLAGLHDTSPYVQRAAADALGQHPATAQVRPLLDFRRHVPAEDSQLLHVSLMSLRNQLVPAGSFAQFQEKALGETDAQAIADVALGVQSTEAGAFLLRYIQQHSPGPEKLMTCLRHVARYAPETELGTIATFTRTHFKDDLDFQLSLFKSTQEGAGQRGGALPVGLRDWGAELAERLLVSIDPATLEWRNSPIKGADSTNPWFLRARESADGDKSSQFLCSLPPGGERLTGILRSRSFSIPEKLGFFLAGHDGPPEKPRKKKNLIRLRDATNHEILAHTAPPRNDIAQPFTWDLKADSGKQGYLEIVDGDNGSAYAWLAVGRFSPAVVSLPAIIPSQVDKRQLAAAELTGSLHLTNLEPKVAKLLLDQNADSEARAAAAKALITLNPEAHWSTCSQILSDPDEPIALRGKTAQILGDLNFLSTRTTLLLALGTAPTALQTLIGQALAGTADGAELLLQAVADGKASARLLQDRNVKDRLNASKPPNLSRRIKELTANLAPPSEQRQLLIDQRRSNFNRNEASLEAGAQVFKQSCALCHSVDGQGAVIGPQLDGVGSRGADRLFEDILDPNRNVDRAFRNTILVLQDGDVQSGLFRREEGQMLVLADSTGKEISIPKQNVKERRESETSLMPDNFGDIIPASDLNNLVAYLLGKGIKSAAQK